MPPVRIDPADLASALPPGGLTIVSSCSAESNILGEAVEQAGAALGPMTFTGIFVPGLNKRSWLASPQARVRTYFMTPELKAAGKAVDFLPLCYADILASLRRAPPTAALLMVAPPDGQGLCSFGPAVDFAADLWPDIPVRIAHINPSMPRTPGDRGIPFSELTAWTEGEQALAGVPDEPADDAASAIAGHVAGFVPDGATLQTGLGKIPGAVLRALVGHRNLKLHTGLVGDAVLDLIASGAIAAPSAATVGVAIGSPRLYASLTDPVFDFRPVSVTHDPLRLAKIADLVTINSAIEVDLFGQVYAELTPRGLMSGPGGASDFARGARLGGGLRIIALPASAGTGRISRIVPAGAGAGPVSLGRMDVDVVVTEHGAADLRNKGYDARARALIAISDPARRDELAAAWSEQCKRL